MSAEEAADLLASLADKPEVASGAPTRRSGRSRRISIDDNEETPEQPRKRAKKPAGASHKHAGASKSDSDLKKTIRDLKKQLSEAQSARKAAESAKEQAENAKKSSDVLIKGQKNKIKALEDVIEGTETGELLGQLKAAKREVDLANKRVTEALNKEATAVAEKVFFDKSLKEKTKELADAVKENNKLSQKIGGLEGKLSEMKENKKKATSEAILVARGKETRKNRTHASNLTTQRQNQTKKAQLKSRQDSIAFLAQQNAQRAAMAQFAPPNVGAGMPRRGFNELPLPFNNGQAANPIQYHQSLQMQQREWGNHAIGQFPTSAWADGNDQQAQFFAWKAAQEANKTKKKNKNTKNAPIEIDSSNEDEEDDPVLENMRRLNGKADDALEELEIENEDDIPASQESNPISDNDADADE